jgi:hypothetical protein
MAVGHRSLEILNALHATPATALFEDFHDELLRQQSEAEPGVAWPAVSPREARLRIARGAPLLPPPFVQTLVGTPEFRALASRVATLLGAHRPEIRAQLDGVDTRDPRLLRFIVTQTRRAFLRPAAVALAPLVDDLVWYRGDCPVCGGPPDLAQVAGDNGRRLLLCSRCDAEWSFPRFTCPFCASDDPADVSYRRAGDGACRLFLCTACHGSLETVDRPEGAITCLPVERILTCGADAGILARGNGFPALGENGSVTAERTREAAPVTPPGLRAGVRPTPA